MLLVRNLSQIKSAVGCSNPRNSIVCRLSKNSGILKRAGEMEVGAGLVCSQWKLNGFEMERNPDSTSPTACGPSSQRIFSMTGFDKTSLGGGIGGYAGGWV